MLRFLISGLLVLMAMVSTSHADRFLYTLTLTDASGGPLNLTTTINSVVLDFFTSDSFGTSMAQTSFASVPIKQGQARLMVDLPNMNTLSYPWTQVTINGTALSPRRKLVYVPLASRADFATMAASATDATNLGGVPASTILTVLQQQSSMYSDEMARSAVLSQGTSLATTRPLLIGSSSAVVTTKIQVMDSSLTERFRVDSMGQTWLTTLHVWQEAMMPSLQVTGMIMADQSLKVGQQMLYAHSTSGVGVNTMMPGATLHVTGHSGAMMPFAVMANGTSHPALHVSSMGRVGIQTGMPMADFSITGRASSWPMAVMTMNAMHPSLAVSSTGYVGVMTAVPKDALDIHGYVRAMGFKDAMGNMIMAPNMAVTQGVGASVAGGVQNTASDMYAFVGGGQLNSATGVASVVVGGQNNRAMGNHALIGAGQSNRTSGMYSSVVGGSSNQADGPYSSIVGGAGNQAWGSHGSVGGGKWNTDTAQGIYNTISGGHMNWTSGWHSAVGGGAMNMAWSTGTISGGESNQAWNYGSVAGGGWNTAADWTFVGGGRENWAGGMYSAIPGGHKLMITAPHSFGFNGHASNAYTISETSVAALLGVSVAINTTSPFADLTVVGRNTSAWSVAVVTAPMATVPALAIENSSGKVGIMTAAPMATLDVQGFARLKMYAAPPMACSMQLAGSIALTSMAQTCACTGGTVDWVWSVNPTKVCTFGAANQ